MNIIRTRYDKSYFENVLAAAPPRSQRDRARLGLIFGHVMEGRLLEVGCGSGGFLQLAEEHFCAEGIDISDYAIEASRRACRARVIHGDIESMQLPPARYDVVAAYGLLEHLSEPHKAIGRIYRATKFGGVFVGSVPNNSGLVGRIATAVMNAMDRTHVSTHAPGRWRAMFREAGFRRIHFLGEIAPTKGTCLLVHHRLWHLVSPNMMFVCAK